MSVITSNESKLPSVEEIRKRQIVFEGVIHTETNQRGTIYRDLDGSCVFLVIESSPEVCLESPLGVYQHKKVLFDSREQAVFAVNRKKGIYQHKNGDIYRVICPATTLFEGTKTEMGYLYEHLFPHQHARYWQPKAIFEEPGRFRLINTTKTELQSLE